MSTHDEYDTETEHDSWTALRTKISTADTLTQEQRGCAIFRPQQLALLRLRYAFVMALFVCVLDRLKSDVIILESSYAPDFIWHISFTYLQ